MVKQKALAAAMAFFAVSGLLAERFKSMPAPLFVIERSTNANTVHYDANLGPDGRLDPREPVSAYWIMSAADGHREELTALEKSKAYGFSIEPGAAPDTYRLRLAAQKQRDIDVVRAGNTVRAEATIGGRRAHLRKLYVSAHKFLPTVKYIELSGIDLASGQPVTEKVVP